MSEELNDSLGKLTKYIQNSYDAKNIDQTDAINYIKILEYKLGDKIFQSEKLTTYKLIDKLIDLLPSAREKYERKISNLKRILDIEPSNKDVTYIIAELYEMLWEHEGAIKYFNKMYELEQNPFYLFRIGMRYRLLNDNNSAIQYFNSCIEKGYEDSDIYRELGEAFISIGDGIGAKTNLLKALELGADEESKQRINQNLSALDVVDNTTELLNKFVNQKNSKPIIPSYSSPDEGKFESYKGNEFFIWRFPAEYEGTEVLRIYDNNSNAIGFWFGEESNIILFGFVFRHQDSPDNIQYLVTIKPRRFEELNSNKMMRRQNSDVMDPEKRKINPMLAFKEYKKLRKYLKKAGVEIIPDFTDIFVKSN